MNKIVIILMLSIVFIILPHIGISCSCIGVSTIESAVKKADAVFEGQVVANKILTIGDKDLGLVLNYMQYKIKVTQRFKTKNRNKFIIVATGTGHGDCGKRFLIGKKYIFYTTFKDGYLYTNICTRTKRTNIVEIRLLRDIVKYGKVKNLYTDF